MVSSKSIVALVVALTIAATVFTPVVDSVNSNTGDVTVDNETATATLDEYSDLKGFNIDETSETVEYYNGSAWVTATEDTDYEMSYGNGSVKPLSGGDISDGDDMRVTYTYAATDGTTTTVVGMIPLFMALLMLGTLANKIQKGL